MKDWRFGKEWEAGKCVVKSTTSVLELTPTLFCGQRGV